MKNKILFVLLFVGITALAQRDKAAVAMMVSQFTQNLEDREITTYFTTTRYCDGTIEMIQMPNGRSCVSNGTFYETYIFWKEGAVQFGKKIDNCGMFTSVELSSSTVFDYFVANVSDFEANPVKPYEIQQVESGPVVGEGTEVNNCHRAFSFKKESTRFTQKFKPFDLTNDATEANINYEYNKALKVVELDKRLDAAIDEIESSPSFMRL